MKKNLTSSDTAAGAMPGKTATPIPVSGKAAFQTETALRRISCNADALLGMNHRPMSDNVQITQEGRKKRKSRLDVKKNTDPHRKKKYSALQEVKIIREIMRPEPLLDSCLESLYFAMVDAYIDDAVYNLENCDEFEHNPEAARETYGMEISIGQKLRSTPKLKPCEMADFLPTHYDLPFMERIPEIEAERALFVLDHLHRLIFRNDAGNSTTGKC